MKLNHDELAGLQDLRNAAFTEGVISVYLRIDPADAQQLGHEARLMDA